MSRGVLTACVVLAAGASVPGFLHRHSPTSQRYLIETMGGGVALFDYDNDGRLDAFFVNGGELGDPHTRSGFARSEPAYWNRLYRQRADGSWDDVTLRAGLHRAGDGNYGMGAATGDFDNDGDADLYITNFGRNQLWRNNGDGTFTDITGAAGAAGGGWSVSAAFLDYDGDGRLDLFVARYLDYDLQRNKLCGQPVPSYCRPEHYPRVTNLLYRNRGDGTFEDVSRAAGLAELRGAGMGVAVVDYDLDGRPDIVVANDGMQQWLLRNRGDGAFEERGLEAGMALSGDGQPFAGMGAAVADFDNDGRFDIAITNLALEKFALYRGLDNGLFEYASAKSGLSAASAQHSGWGLAWVDWDNDGSKDLIVAQGHVLDNVEQLHPGLAYRERPALYRNRGGRFEKVLTAAAAMAGRGLAAGDLDNDGRVETVVAALGGAPVVLRPSATAHHWIGVKLVGTKSPRDGQGAIVRVGQQIAYASTAGSYLSAGDPRLHFGLGAATTATIEVEWPSGKRQKIEKAPADRYLEVTEP